MVINFTFYQIISLSLFSIRYDFKPTSIDQEGLGTLEVNSWAKLEHLYLWLWHCCSTGERWKKCCGQLASQWWSWSNHLQGEFCITWPGLSHHHMSLLAPVITPSSLLFQGNTEPAPAKDCVLIIDHETGELTLERWQEQTELKPWAFEMLAVFDFFSSFHYVETWILCRVTNNIRVKKTRPEKSGGMGSSGEPSSNPYEVKPTPANPYEVKANPPNPYEVRLNSWKEWDLHLNVAFRWSQTLCIRDLQTDNRGSAILVALGQLLHRWTSNIHIEASWFEIHIVFADQESISKTRNSHTSLSRQPQPNQFCQVEVPLN